MDKETQKDFYKKFVAKTSRLQKQRQRRPLDLGIAATDFFTHFTDLAETLELQNQARPHGLALSASMGNLKKTESALGIFTDGFEATAELAAIKIAALTKKQAPEAVIKMIKWWLEASLIAVVGLLEIARVEKPSKEDETPPDSDFKDELILTLLFYSGYPRLVFKNMAEAIEIEESHIPLFISLFETIAAFFALISYSKEELISNKLGEALSGIIKRNLKPLKGGLEKDPEENSEMIAYLDLVEIALEKGELEPLEAVFSELIEKTGYSIKDLKEDIASMKELFKRLKQAYFASQENKMNMMHLVG